MHFNAVLVDRIFQLEFFHPLFTISVWRQIEAHVQMHCSRNKWLCNIKCVCKYGWHREKGLGGKCSSCWKFQLETNFPKQIQGVFYCERSQWFRYRHGNFKRLNPNNGKISVFEHFLDSFWSSMWISWSELE